MKFSWSLAVALVPTIPYMTSGQECTICPNGIEFPDAVVDVPCKDIESLVDVFSEADNRDMTVEDCRHLQRYRVPTCCPSYLDVLAANNPCGFCPNGIVKESENDICTEVLFSTYFTEMNTAESCAGTKSAYAACCSDGSDGSGISSTPYSVCITTAAVCFLALFWAHD